METRCHDETSTAVDRRAGRPDVPDPRSLPAEWLPDFGGRRSRFGPRLDERALAGARSHRAGAHGGNGRAARALHGPAPARRTAHRQRTRRGGDRRLGRQPASPPRQARAPDDGKGPGRGASREGWTREQSSPRTACWRRSARNSNSSRMTAEPRGASRRKIATDRLNERGDSRTTRCGFAVAILQPARIKSDLAMSMDRQRRPERNTPGAISVN